MPLNGFKLPGRRVDRLSPATPAISRQSSNRRRSWHGPTTTPGTWRPASGATATMVAAQRALSNREGLIDDPFAEPLVRAVGLDFFIRALDGEIELEDVDPEFNMRRAAEGMAVRTRWFDKLFTDAAAAGVRQAVILAAGLDATGLSAAVARRNDRVRARPARGHRVQDPRPWRDLGAQPKADATHRSPSICATTGRKRCWTTGSIPPSPPRGSPRAC